MSESEENEENTPPVYVLLPICNEMNTDVFLNILKSMVLKERVEDNFHKNSMKSAMNGEKFQIDIEDLSVNWEKMTSDLRRIRQSKLLGCWAALHYPLFGKKLIGAAWQPPKKFNVQVSGSIELTDTEIDNIVSKKMKLRIVELNVCKSTLDRLKYFVKAPINIGRINVTILSSKMRTFDIDSEYLAGCWQALKLGGFPSNFEQQMNSIASFKAPPQPSIITSHLTIDQHRIIRRDGDQSTVEKRNSRPTRLSNATWSSSQDIMMSPCNVLLTNIIESAAKVNVASEPTNIQTAKRARCVSPSNSTTTIMHDEPNFDTLRVAVFEMREDIRNLAKSIKPNTAENNNESTNDLERFHLAVFKQKDAEISKLAESNDKLQEELTAVKTRLACIDSDFQCEKQDLLQKLSAATQLNCDLTDTNEKLREELNVAKNQSANVESRFQYQMQELVQKLSAADQVNIELTETNGKLQEDLNAVKNHFANMESNVQCQIQDLLHKLSVADQINIELTDINGKLQEELTSVKTRLACLDSDFQCEKQDLLQKLSAATQLNCDLTDTNEKLREELNVAKNQSANVESRFQYQMQELVQKLSAADQVNIELTETNGKLQEDLNAVKNHFANMESNVQCQIQDLLHKLSVADQINIELTDTNGKLQHELNAAKMKIKENEKLSKTLHSLKTRTNNLINEFQIRVEESEKLNAQLAAENEKLQELNISMQNAVKSKELFQLTSLLPNRPEAHIQTVRTEALDLNKENIQCVGVPGDNHEEKLPEPVNGECITVEPNGGALDDNQQLPSEEEFVSDDPIVQKCRPVLKRQKYGWMKFQRYQNSKFLPAFVYPADADGIERAQKIKADGYITNTKFLFWEFKFAWELPNERKLSQEVLALKKFNQRFGFNCE